MHLEVHYCEMLKAAAAKTNCIFSLALRHPYAKCATDGLKIIQSQYFDNISLTIERAFAC
jgi:hypothetical protein